MNKVYICFMIKANELRIGNFVEYWKRNEVVTIAAIHDGCFYPKGFKDGCLVAFQFKPIPLTEEWFLKLGFEYKETDKSDTYRNGLFRANYVREGRFKGKRYLVIANVLDFQDFGNIQYVHQLQNLFFALTGTELEIKEPARQN